MLLVLTIRAVFLCAVVNSRVPRPGPGIHFTSARCGTVTVALAAMQCCHEVLAPVGRPQPSGPSRNITMVSPGRRYPGPHAGTGHREALATPAPGTRVLFRAATAAAAAGVVVVAQAMATASHHAAQPNPRC